MIYSNKIIKKEFNEQIIKAHRLSPIINSVESVKLIKVVLPSLGSLGDALVSKDRSLVFATCLNLFAQNSSIEHFESMQQKLLGGILDNEGEPLKTVANINTWLEAHEDVNQYDLMIWLFGENLLKPLMASEVVKANLAKLEGVKGMFEDMFIPVQQPTDGVTADEQEE